MKRFFTFLIMALMIGATTALAQATNDGKYTLKNGKTTMVIDAAKGAKILSLKYGDQEVISQLRWPEAFGSTFWTSPQKEWNWPPVPEYDKRPYQVEEKNGVLSMTSEVSERLKFRIRKSFAVDEKSEAFVITYSIINESNEARKVAPWEITRVQNEGGLIFFEAPVEGIKPAGLMNFKEAYGAAWYQTDEANQNRKVNADGKGWLAYFNKGLLLVKQFDDLNASQPAPDEAEIQVYVNRGKAHIELESQGAYKTLQPKEELQWTVRWYLQPFQQAAEPSGALLQQVKKMLKKDEAMPLIQNIDTYESSSLNGDWNYIVDVQEEGYYDYRMKPTPWGFFRNAKPQRPEDLIEYDFDKAPTMKIPSDWNTQDERLFFYEGTVWFKKSFQAVPVPDYRTLLYFGAVNYDCIVWVNGKKVGHHVGGFTPFHYDISNLLQEGENVVIVKVDNKRHAEDVPTLSFDWWNYGGITRDVKLVKMPMTYLEDYSLQLKKATEKAKQREISFTAKLNAKEAGHKVCVFIPELKLEQQLTTDAEGKVSATLKVPAKKLQLWSPENPKLYQVRISLDTTTLADEIGFRTIETRDKQILLNGQPIFLKGICIHEEKPNGGGRANSIDDARTLLGWAKELGCNYVRLAHYPHNEKMVREAERMGILVWSEIPCYWTIEWTNPKTFENAKQQLTDMIARDHNRANIIIWSIANETPHSAERDNFLGRLAKYARSLDDTRLISMAMEVTGASNYVNRLNDNMNQYVDVVSFNQYVGWYRDVNDAPKMKWEIPYNKPVIISEFGGGARYGYHGAKNQRWTEEFQENLYIENLAMLDKIEGLAGTTPWILKDFRSPRRVLNGIQDYYNRKGLVSDKGEKKKAFYVLRKWYEGK